MTEFVREGRIVRETRVCRAGEDWRQAVHVPWLAKALEATAHSIVRHAPATPDAAVVVWARIASYPASQFEAVLGALGANVEIEPGLWLLRTGKPLPEVRARLSGVLSSSDQFFIAAVTDRIVGWRNLGPTTEARLRDLFRAIAAYAPAND
jgi:hypothetical protein